MVEPRLYNKRYGREPKCGRELCRSKLVPDGEAEEDEWRKTHMRAFHGYAFTALSAFLLVASVPSANAQCATAIGAAVAPPCAGVAGVGTPLFLDRNGTPQLLDQPAVVAPACGGAAILSEGPRDLDMRRDALERRITEAAAIGQIGGGLALELKGAMQGIQQTEATWLAAGPLDNWQARRLYRAMDRVHARLVDYTSPAGRGWLGLGRMWDWF